MKNNIKFIRVKDLNKYKYNFSHPLQRSSGQWTVEQKALLIDSLLKRYHIDSITLAESKDEEGVYDVIDGMQRLSTILDFVANKFKLHKSISAHQSEDYANKEFSELDEEVKESIEDAELEVVIMSDYTADELREVFRRKNNGKPLTKSQKHTVLLDKSLFNRINKILSYDATDAKGKKVKNFWNRVVSAALHRSSDDRTLVLQSLMLLDDAKFTGSELQSGFKAEDIEKYIVEFQAYDDSKKNELLDKVDRASKELNTYLDTLDKPLIRQIKKLTIPMLVAGMSLALEHGVSAETYTSKVSELLKFLEEHRNKPKDERVEHEQKNPNDNHVIYYQNYNAQATASKDKVNGRWNVFHAMATLPGEESTQEVEAEDIVNESVAGHNTDNNDIDISKFPFLEGATIPRDISDEMTQKEEAGQKSSENEATNVLEEIAPIETTEEDDALLAEQVEAYRNGEVVEEAYSDDELMQLFNSLPSVELTEISAPEVNTTETEEENE